MKANKCDCGIDYKTSLTGLEYCPSCGLIRNWDTIKKEKTNKKIPIIGKCSICKNKEILQMHHIIPRRIKRKTATIILCFTCHKIADKIANVVYPLDIKQDKEQSLTEDDIKLSQNLFKASVYINFFHIKEYIINHIKLLKPETRIYICKNGVKHNEDILVDVEEFKSQIIKLIIETDIKSEKSSSKHSEQNEMPLL